MTGRSVRIGHLAIETPRAPARGGARLAAAVSAALARADLSGMQSGSLGVLRIDLAPGAGEADIARAVAEAVARAARRGQG